MGRAGDRKQAVRAGSEEMKQITATHDSQVNTRLPVDLYGVPQDLLRQTVALQLVQNQTLEQENGF